MTAGALRRAIRRAPDRSAALDRCGMCAGPVGPAHRHVLDEGDPTVMCVCTPCSLLFERDAAGGGHYRLIPTRRTRLTGVSVEGLPVPVGLAFFVKQGDGRVLAHYPSPLGTTESEIDAAAWHAVQARSPALAEVKPLVEAFLMWTDQRRGDDEHWILPLDDCFRLVALIRRNWTGMSGGSAVWREIARFFDDLRRQFGRHTATATTTGRHTGTG